MKEILFKVSDDDSCYDVKSDDDKSVILHEGRLFVELVNDGNGYTIDFKDGQVLDLDYDHMEYLWMLYEVMMEQDNNVIDKFKRIG